MRVRDVPGRMCHWLKRRRSGSSPAVGQWPSVTGSDPVAELINQAETLPEVWRFLLTWLDASSIPHLLLSVRLPDGGVHVRHSLQPLPQPVLFSASEHGNHLVQSMQAGDTTFCGNRYAMGSTLLNQWPEPQPNHWFSIPFRAGGKTIAVLTAGFFQMDRHSQAQVSRAYLIKDRLAPLIRSCLLEEHQQQTFDPRQVTIQALMAALAAKDPYTHGHCYAVSGYSLRLAQACSLADDEHEAVRLAGLLHDIGKIGIPCHILTKPAALTEVEWRIMKQHPAIGADTILNALPSVADLRELVLLHHERWDGSGYPYGLKADAIPLGSRIVSVADAFHGLTSHRTYRPALRVEEALAVLWEGAHQHWDAEVIHQLETLVLPASGAPGRLVRPADANDRLSPSLVS